jgi:hypothetical protein
MSKVSDMQIVIAEEMSRPVRAEQDFGNADEAAMVNAEIAAGERSDEPREFPWEE